MSCRKMSEDYTKNKKVLGAVASGSPTLYGFYLKAPRRVLMVKDWDINSLGSGGGRKE